MPRPKNFAILMLVLSLLVLPSATSSRSAPQQRSRIPSTKFVTKKRPIPNRYIVALDDDIVADDLPLEVRREQVAAIANSHAQPHGGKVDFIYETAVKGYAVELPNEAAAIAITRLPQVRWVEEDGLGEWHQAPASPQPSPPWGLDAIDGSFPLPVPTPDVTTGRTNGFYNFNANGSGVSAYVLDTGINTAHTEFQTPFVSRAIQAADCFTFVNCVGGQQTSFFNQQICVFPMPNSTNNDCSGHGTFVAGVLGGNTFGTAKNVTIRSVKIGSTDGPIDSAVVAGMNWVTGQHQANSAVPALVNVSFGTDDEPEPLVEAAAINSMAAGVTYVASAGNENGDARIWAPQNVEDTIVVSGVDWTGTRASSANWGPAVDIFAPGVRIASARTGNAFLNECGPWNGANNNTCVLSGTSFAAPFVSGAIAMYLQGRPAVSNTCGAFHIDQNAANLTLNVSTCPDRVARYIIANARRDILTNVNGTLPSANRFISTTAIPGPANPIDNNPFFVWTQYRDFLNRDPDSGGFSNWVGNLNTCSPSDWSCLNTQRIHAVRGFIESGEFKAGKPALSNPSSLDQYNREYVIWLYRCLLRREPDAGGLATYQNELNSTGDYDHAVHGFINSGEYRRRFGPQ